MANQRLTIGELSKAAHVGAETVRYYERIGLMPRPARTAANYRLYSAEQLARLSFIRRSRELGFTLDRIKALLELAGDRARDCQAVDVIASDHLAEVERKIADLTALRRTLRDLIGQCRHGTIADCRIIEALSPVPA
ncbi:MAG: helix-turn-helix domain-containing protein [Alphaproteobacteria bacterium]|nr:helix-turn-helix domain-containing protein [Alphaproteobacteria bacterium]